MRVLLAAVALLLLTAGPASAAMSIDSGPKAAVEPYQVTIWWHSSDTGSSELRWDTSAKPWANMANDISNTTTTLGTVHSRTISNLREGTYYFRVRTTGAAGTATSAVRRIDVGAGDGATPTNAVVLGGGSSTSSEPTVKAVLESGSRVYLGGDFTQIGTRLGKGIQVDASTGGLLGNDGAPQVAGTVRAAISDGSGGWYVGGDFTRVGGLVRNGVAHLLPDGGIDPYFDPGVGPDGSVRALARSGSMLYVGGLFQNFSGTSRRRIAAVDATSGALATSFNPGTGAGSDVNAIAVSGGRLYIGGAFTTYAGTGRNRIAAIDAATGALDVGFDPGTGAGSTVHALLVDGTRLYLGGAFTTINGTSRARVGAVNSTSGALDATFDPGAGADGTVYALARSGTRLYLGGFFANINGSGRAQVAALTAATGALDTGFNPGTGTGGSGVYGLDANASRVTVVGAFTTFAGTSRPRLAALNPTTGALLAGFDPGTGANATAYAVASASTSTFVGGYFTTYGGLGYSGVAAVNSTTGAIDTGFNPGTGIVGQGVYSLAIQGTRLYVGGQISSYNGTGRGHILAVNATTGAIDTGFAPTGANNTVLAVLATASRLYVAGWFTTMNGTSRNGVAALNLVTGAIDAGFDPGTGTGTGTDRQVRALALSGTRLYLGGNFSVYNGTARVRAAAVNATTGTLDVGFDPGAGPAATVEALAVSGTRLYVGGSFLTVAGASRRGVAAINSTTGVLDAGFDPGTGGSTVYALAVDGSQLYVGGSFTTFNGTSRQGLAVVDAASGALDATKIIGRGNVEGLAVGASWLHVVGDFYDYGTVAQSGLAMLPRAFSTRTDLGPLAITIPAQHSVAPYQTTIWWTTSTTSSSELVWDRTSRNSFSDYQYSASNTVTDLGTAHSRTLGNLPQGTYFYRVRSRTSGGEQVTSAEYSFTVTPPNAATPIGSTVTDSRVLKILTSGDRTYLAGEFRNVGPRVGGGVELDLASAARVGSGGLPQVAGAVRASVPDGSGGWYIAGDFTAVGGLRRINVAHLLPDGGVDPIFDPGNGPDGNVDAITFGNGRVYIGGWFANVNGTARNYLAALDATTGAVDVGFNPGTGPDNAVFALAFNGTRVYVGGQFGTFSGSVRGRIAAVNATTGVLDAGFVQGTGASSSVNAILVSGGRVYIGGLFGTYNGTARGRVAALNPTTALLDATFMNALAGADSNVNTLAISGTSIYLGGSFTTVNGTARERLAAVNSTTGAVVAAFDVTTGANSAVRSLAVSGSRLYVAGDFSAYKGTTRPYLVAVNTTTAALDGGFVPGTGTSTPTTPASIYTVVTDGTRLHVGGYFATWDAVDRPYVAAIDAETGELDGTFAPPIGPDAYVNDMAISGNRLYVVGVFQNVDGVARGRIAALNATTGALDAPFMNGLAGANASVTHLSLVGTRLYVAGSFATVNGVARVRVAAVNSTTGAIDAFMSALAGPDAAVNALVANATNVYIAGSFLNVNGSARSRIAALNPTTGAIVAGFNPAGGADNTVYSLALDGTTLYVGGGFANYGGVARSRIAAANATTGANLAAFNPGAGASSLVQELYVDGSRLWLGGSFQTFDATPRVRIAAVDKTTAALDPFDPGDGPNGSVNALEVIGDEVRFGGLQLAYDGISQGGVAHLDRCDRTTFCANENLRDYLTMSVPLTTVPLGMLASDTSSTAAFDVQVQSNAFFGYSLHATDTSDTIGMPCVSAGCTGFNINDWTGTPATPSVWPEGGASYGFGVTLLGSTSEAKDTNRWGAGTLPTDFGTNKYVGLDLNVHALLHRTSRYWSSGVDTTQVGVRTRVGPTQSAGDYEATLTITAVANP